MVAGKEDTKLSLQLCDGSLIPHSRDGLVEEAGKRAAIRLAADLLILPP